MIEIDMDRADDAYQALSEQEKEIIREALDSPLAGVMNKIFPEIMQAIGTFQKPRRKMDAEMRQVAAGVLMR